MAKSHNNENAISSIFIVAPRGDVIIKREYRKDVPENQAEIFFRLVKFWGAIERNRNEDGGNGGVIIGKENENEINGVGEGGSGTMDHSAPAAFNDQGVNYLHVKANGVYVVATTRANCSPSFVLELLHRIAKVIKDYCGTLSEDAVRKNAILTYELLDEMVDYGIPQSTSTAALEKHIFNDPVVVSESTSALGALGTTGRLAIQKTLDMRTGIDGVDRAIGTAKTAVIDGQKSQTYKKAAGAFDKILSSKISKNLMSKVDDVLAKGGSSSGGGDGDGKIQLSKSPADTILTAAKLIVNKGWKPRKPWFEEVVLSTEFPWQEAGLGRSRSIAEWINLGVKPRNNAFFGSDYDEEATLILPQGRNGPKFLAYQNFNIFMKWNNSFMYSTTAAYLANRLKGDSQYLQNDPEEILSLDQMVELQEILSKLGYDVGKIDGILGAKTRQSVRKIQISLGFPADSWPTIELLNYLKVI